MSLISFIKIFFFKQIYSFYGNPIKEYKLDFYISLLKESTPFSFARYGDGEWNAILGKKEKNCDQHENFPALSKDLQNALINKGQYFYAIQPRAIKNQSKEILSYLKVNKIKILWHDSDVFHDANLKSKLYPLIEQLRKMNVIVVGPKHLEKISPKVFKFANFIEVPSINCYLKKDEIIKEISQHAESNNHYVFALSASMLSNVIIHELFLRFGKKHWFIDFGSIWDIYAGVKSRGYFCKDKWEKRIIKNLGG
jgi:predicted glycosyltransferase